MATATKNFSTWRYNIDGGDWQQGSGHDVSVGVTQAGRIFRGYITFSLADISSTYIINSASFTFTRADNYGNVSWDIGIRDSAPPKTFSQADFTTQIANDYASSSNQTKTISITSSQLKPYAGKTVYVCICGYNTSSYSYGDIETDTAGKLPTLTVDYSLAKSTISSASNGTIGTQQTITVSRQDASYTHTLTASCAGRTETIATKSAAVSFNWTPSVANFAPRITTSMSASCTYTLETFSGNTSVGTDTRTVTLSLAAADVKPSVSLAVTDPTGYASTYGGYIVGKSKYTVTVTPTLQYSATLSSTVIHSNGGTQYSSPTTTGVVNAGASSIDTTITDSRGQTATASTTTTLLTYTNPSLSGVSVYRSNAGGTADPAGAYLRVDYTWAVTSLNSHNSRTLTVKYKKRSASTYTSAAQTISAYSGTGNYVFAADIESSYDVQVVLSDDFSTVTVTRQGSTAAVVFDIYKDGTGFAFGKVAEQSGLDIAWNSYFRLAPRLYANALWIDENNVVRTRIDRTIGSNGIWLYDTAGNQRIFLASTDGNIRNYDSTGQERVGLYPAEGQLALYNSSGTRTVQIRGDGTASSNPLPVNQGGTGFTNGTLPYRGISAAPTETYCSFNFRVTSAFTIAGANGGTITIPNWSHGTFVSSSDAMLIAYNNMFTMYVAYRNNGTWKGQMIPTSSISQTLAGTVTNTTGTTTAAARIVNNVVTLTLSAKNSSNVTAGANIAAGTITGLPKPVSGVTGASYYGTMTAGAQFNADGTFAVRALGVNYPANAAIGIGLVYITDNSSTT